MDRQDVHALGRHIATFAGRAPSVHNTQPWHFSLDGHLLHVYANPARRLLTSDPDGREMLISCGAAIRFAELVAEQYVDRVEVTYFPNQVRRLHLATIELGGTVVRPATPATGVEETIGARWSDRRPFDAPDRAAVADQLALVSKQYRRCSATIAGPDTVALIAAMGSQHHLASRYDANYRHELRWWAAGRAYSDGISPERRPVDPDIAPPTGRFFPAGTLKTGDVEDKAELGLITSPVDEPLDWVHSGRLLADVLLSATASGLHSCTLTHFLEPVPGESDSPRMRGANHSAVQAAVRIGRATGPELPSPTRRLSVDSIFEIW
ncbi:Acg family FMN-binding oxidoreductase [Jongsikchunia kroppenstedtii]|uniref:Acg family FMN-binding oxidoreductase n=1 Tax=Jongsikchunia kroppenstedtii TaxID=1121721 RepID=UPI0003823E53|nr:hypothetical protein [Jongsikchunia kroppenstedtii]